MEWITTLKTASPSLIYHRNTGNPIEFDTVKCKENFKTFACCRCMKTETGQATSISRKNDASKACMALQTLTFTIVYMIDYILPITISFALPSKLLNKGDDTGRDLKLCIKVPKKCSYEMYSLLSSWFIQPIGKCTVVQTLQNTPTVQIWFPQTSQPQQLI